MGSVFTPVVAALAALLGVIVGQFWQSRREEVRWRREQELEAARREEQRNRDRELWAREDRNRFNEQKRQIYFEYQTVAYRLSVLTVDITDYYSSGRPSTEDDGLREASEEFERRFLDLYNELKVVRNHLRIMAPIAVLAAVTQIDQALIDGPSALRTRNAVIIRQLWERLRIGRLALFDSMRNDLNPERTILGDGADRQFVPTDESDRWFR